MRTMSQSDRTRVPPVTALRSPPLSRITGALSPVMALSSTDATPTVTSPSPGIVSPVSTSTRSPFLSCDPGTTPTIAFGVRFPKKLRHDVSPCAFERSCLRFASSLGHGFGKIGEQQGKPEPEADGQDKDRPFLAIAEEGLNEEQRRQDTAHFDDEHDRVLDQMQGVELDDGIRTGPAGGICRSRREKDGVFVCMIFPLYRIHVRCSATGPRARAGMKVRAPTRTITATRKRMNRGVCVGSVPRSGGDKLLSRKGTRRCQDCDHKPETPDQHGHAEGRVVKESVRAQPGKCTAVVVRCGREGIQDLGKAMRARIGNPGKPRRDQDGCSRSDQDHGGRDQDDEGGHLYFEGLDLLA